MALSRSASGPVLLGSTVTYTCSSTGGDPAPTLQLKVNGVTEKEGPTTQLTFDLATLSAHHNAEVKCVAFNDEGSVEDVETLQLYRECARDRFFSGFGPLSQF